MHSSVVRNHLGARLAARRLHFALRHLAGGHSSLICQLAVATHDLAAGNANGALCLVCTEDAPELADGRALVRQGEARGAGLPRTGLCAFLVSDYGQSFGYAFTAAHVLELRYEGQALGVFSAVLAGVAVVRGFGEITPDVHRHVARLVAGKVRRGFKLEAIHVR